MHRRDFLKLAAGAGVLPLASKLGRAADAGAAGPATSYPLADYQAVVNESSGPGHATTGPVTWDVVPTEAPVPGLAGEGPYQPIWDSFQQYEAPEWYRDQKFGMWAHWSPQCVAEDGDWYARRMYLQDSRPESMYNHHLAHYGHPSKFGYKDLCSQWTLLDWDPDALIARYKEAGARMFFALANHHDGFDAWNSRFHPWNSKNIGPHRDVVGEWAAACRRQSLRFGVTVHAARNWWWFQVARLCDQTGPLAGVPYDGHLTLADGKGQWWEGYDPAILYGPMHGTHEMPDAAYLRNFYDRVRDLIDQYDPDMLYFDDTLLPLGWAGMNIGAYFYNHNLKTRGGKMEAVLNIKGVPDRLAKTVVADYERGITAGIMPHPWQSETCLGQWHYNRRLFRDHAYMKPGQAIQWLVDVVSKNGTFILNIPGKPDGTIDSDEVAVLEALTGWIKTNGEAIYSTRPWKVFGEGPHMARAAIRSRNQFDARDIRFTRSKRGDVVYAIVLGWPQDGFLVRSLGTAAQTKPGKVAHVQILGTDERLSWKQAPDGLRVDPVTYRPPNDYAVALKVELAGPG